MFSSLRIRTPVPQFLLSLMHACVPSVLGNRCKVKAPLVNDFAMTTYGDVIVKVHSFLTTGLGRGKRSALRPGRFITREKLLLLLPVSGLGRLQGWSKWLREG